MKYMKLGSKPDAFQADGNNIKVVATELTSDIVVSIGDVKFFLHKFPLLSKSFRLKTLITAANKERADEIFIHDIPGGPAAFEICAKFCYGMVVTLNAHNVVAARCAAEYLEMHESIEKGNLIYKIEVFLNSSIFCTWKDPIIVLQTTSALLPWSEDLRVVSHCIDTIVSKACTDLSDVEWSYTYSRKKLPSECGADPNWNGIRKQHSIPKDWWVEDLCELEMTLYKRVLLALRMKRKMPTKILGEALKVYAFRRIPGFGSGTLTFCSDPAKIHDTIETVVLLLPSELGSVSCNFLLKLLSAASVLECSDNCKKELIKRIGQQLEEASVEELLIPAAAGESTVYNIDLVLSIVEEFIMKDIDDNALTGLKDDKEFVERSLDFISDNSKIAVTKLIDSYLAEIAKDHNLPLTKFIALAEMISTLLPQKHDDLYQAVDIYLKEHPNLTKSEKKQICGLIDCEKLSADACMHAVQNERLPLRLVVQILFFEQMKASMGAPGGIRNLPEIVEPSVVLRENVNGSSRSATTTTTEDDWDGVPSTVSKLKPLCLMSRDIGNQRSKSSNDIIIRNHDNKGIVKFKGMLIPKKLLSKLWSGKVQGCDNSSSSTSESPGSMNQEESKSTHSRTTRHSVS